MRILAIDPGDKRLGLAISDHTGTIANPLMVLNHVSRLVDAATISQIARENNVQLIVIGQALDIEGKTTPQSRRAMRLARAIKSQISLPIELWDETNSTKIARSAKIELGVRRKKRTGHLDDLAAVVILQSYINQIADFPEACTQNRNQSSNK